MSDLLANLLPDGSLLRSYPHNRTRTNRYPGLNHRNERNDMAALEAGLTSMSS